MKILAVVSEPVDESVLRTALGDGARDAEVLVLAPALNDSALAYWVSDSDEAIERAEQVQEESVERLEETGVDAAGDTGESDPVTAVRDALAGFDADRIVVVRHPGGQGAYREDELLDGLDGLGPPVEQLELRR